MNATKNDESEAIEKLNKEIAALRKRLEAQAGGGGVSSAEARIMEERFVFSPISVVACLHYRVLLLTGTASRSRR